MLENSPAGVSLVCAEQRERFEPFAVAAIDLPCNECVTYFDAQRSKLGYVIARRVEPSHASQPRHNELNGGFIVMRSGSIEQSGRIDQPIDERSTNRSVTRAGA